jgi:carboxyl-terminal processing protease
VAIKMGDPAQDYQLARALDLIRGLSLYRPGN